MLCVPYFKKEILPASTVRDVFPNFSNINCFVHLYVEMDQFLIFSIREAPVLITVESSFGVVGVDWGDVEPTLEGPEFDLKLLAVSAVLATLFSVTFTGGVSFNISWMLVRSELALLGILDIVISCVHWLIFLLNISGILDYTNLLIHTPYNITTAVATGLFDWMAFIYQVLYIHKYFAFFSLQQINFTILLLIQYWVKE